MTRGRPRKYTDEQLKSMLQQIASSGGKLSPSEVRQKLSTLTSTLSSRFGNVRNAIQEAGLQIPERIPDRKTIVKEMLDLKKKVGRTPTRVQIIEAFQEGRLSFSYRTFLDARKADPMLEKELGKKGLLRPKNGEGK